MAGDNLPSIMLWVVLRWKAQSNELMITTPLVSIFMDFIDFVLVGYLPIELNNLDFTKILQHSFPTKYFTLSRTSLCFGKQEFQLHARFAKTIPLLWCIFSTMVLNNFFCFKLSTSSTFRFDVSQARCFMRKFIQTKASLLAITHGSTLD